MEVPFAVESEMEGELVLQRLEKLIRQHQCRVEKTDQSVDHKSITCLNQKRQPLTRSTAGVGVSRG